MSPKILIAIISDNNAEQVKKSILETDNIENADLLIMDDGSDYDIMDLISKYKKVKCIKHEMKQGYGACVDAAFDFSRDMEYDYIILLGCDSSNLTGDVNEIIKNLEYGYDIVNCSRVLENYEYNNLEPEMKKFYEEIAAQFNEETGLDITDPLSENKGFNVQSIEHILLTELTHGVHLQILIQGQFYGGNIIEIPSESGLKIGKEIADIEYPLEHYLAVITTEKFLFNKGPVN